MQRLIVYRNLLNDKRFILLNRLSSDSKNPAFTEQYYLLCSLLLNDGGGSILDQLFSLVLSDENVFSLRAENGKDTRSIKTAVIHDIAIFKHLTNIDFKQLALNAGDKNEFLCRPDSLLITKRFKDERPDIIFDYLSQAYNENGCGRFHQYTAFRLDDKLNLLPIKNFNPMHMEKLYGYDSQKQQLSDNTRRFTSGTPALNVLLFGDRGTGKSTAVKSLVPMFKNNKLKLIEIDKDKLSALPKLLDMLSERGYYFIVFIDDLSFESDDSDYKFLKSVIQGSLYEHADNVLFYVTSNRRNLVKQSMAERENEVSISDLLNETASLTDRFGLKLYFHKPSQDEFKRMVKHIAKNNNMNNIDTMMDEAVQFARFNGGLNGRSAQQFIDSKIT